MSPETAAQASQVARAAEVLKSNVLLAQLSVSVLKSRTSPRTPNGMERSGIVCVCMCARDMSRLILSYN